MIYVDRFEDEEQMLAEFDAPEDALEGCKVLFAYYYYGEEEGDALVLYQTADGRLFEVRATHTALGDLDNCWRPKETSWMALADRTLGTDDANKVLQKLLKKHLVVQ